MVEDVQAILKELYPHNTTPRLEVDGENVVYIIRDWYEDTSYITAYDIETVTFPKSAIEELIAKALASKDKEAMQKIEAERYVYKERWDDYAGTHDGGPEEYRNIPLSIHLKIGKKPVIEVTF